MAILKYIGRRLLVLIPVLLGISLAAFLLGRIAPGDPVDDALFRIGIEFPTEEDRADMRAELGLDRPLPVQYLDWLGDALRGDLGRSYIGNKDIAQELMTRLPITLKVSLAAMLAAVVFGVGGGVLMAACQVLIYRYAPVEQTIGLVQKIFYTHLPLAWWSFVSFFLV